MRTRDLTLVASRPVPGDTGRVTDRIDNLARQYYAELLRILRARLHNEQDAADLAQEAYARLLRYGRQCSGEELRSVLFRIANNLLADHWRWRHHRRGHMSLDVEGLTVLSEEPAQDRRLAAEQELARLEEIVLRMPEKRRQVFLMSRVQGLANAEIAAQCGISLKTVEKHLALAMAECRERTRQEDP